MPSVTGGWQLRQILKASDLGARRIGRALLHRTNGHTRRRVHSMNETGRLHRALRPKNPKNFSKTLAFEGDLFYTTEAVCLGMKR